MVSSYVQKRALSKLFDITLHKTIMTGLYNLIESVTSIKKLDHNDFNSIITELDLDFKLELIQGFLDDISNMLNTDENVTHIHTNVTRSLTVSLNYLNKAITEIHTLINVIKNKIEYHKTKYFNYYRTFDVSEDLLKLKQEHDILMARFNLIMKIFNFKNILQ
jgi:archaellum component FlaC